MKRLTALLLATVMFATIPMSHVIAGDINPIRRVPICVTGPDSDDGVIRFVRIAFAAFLIRHDLGCRLVTDEIDPDSIGFDCECEDDYPV